MGGGKRRSGATAPHFHMATGLHPERDKGSTDFAEPKSVARVVAPDDFVFDYNGKRTQFSDKELLAEVRAFGEVGGGRAFTMVEFNRWKKRRCAANCIARRFGTWRRALALVGIAGVKAAAYGAEELIEHLEAVWREMGRPPGVRSIR